MSAVWKPGALTGFAILLGSVLTSCLGGSVSTEGLGEIDPAIYSRRDDPADPYSEQYAKFRERRELDRTSESSPRPLDRYPSFHRTREMPWQPIESVWNFDWPAVEEESAEEALALREAVKVRVGFDHPDLKIVQIMIGKGGTLPAHAEGAPGVLIVVGGEGEIRVEGENQRVTAGTTVKLDPYDVRRLRASDDQVLRVLWIRWAPTGDQSYIDAGYYLTGANQHIQPEQAAMTDAFRFFGKDHETVPTESTSNASAARRPGSREAERALLLGAVRARHTGARSPYPGVPRFGHESRIPWLTAKQLRGSGFFFSKDLAELPEVGSRMLEVARHKAVYRASRADGRWDFNISETAWGPRATYVEHSHVIPEFYYMMSGPVLYGVDGDLHRVERGDIVFNNSYSPHLARGITDGLVFTSLTSTWAPGGDRSVFEHPAFLVEALPEQPDSARMSDSALFHPKD